MTTQSQTPTEPQTLTRTQTHLLGAYQLALGALLLWLLLFEVWPKNGQEISEAIFLEVVLICGGIGGLLHGLRSFANFTGNRKLLRHWVWWYVMKAPIGALLALIFYFLARAGLLVLIQEKDADPSLPGMAGLAMLAGMFSNLAALKLHDIFCEIIKPPEEKLADPLEKNDKSSPDPEKKDPQPKE